MARRRLRVAIVAPSLRILGGQAVQADRLLRAWRGDPDVDAWLVPHNPLPPRLLRWALGVKYARTVATELTYAPLLVRELARADIAHVFSASYSSFMLAPLPAAAVARALGKPVVLNYHSGEAPDHLARSRAARAALARMDQIAVPSPFLAGVFERFGLDATVVPNLVDLEGFAFRERQPLRPRLLSTRNLDYPYNVACTLRAFRHVQDRRPDASLTLAGGGAHEPALRDLAGELQLANLHFLGRVPPDRIAAVYADHDIYVQSPDIDNMPLSLLEAFASGLPAVSTDAGGVPMLLRHGHHGLLTAVGDDRALGERVLELLDRPDAARQMARAARASCEPYSWSAIRPQWLQLYDSVVNPGLRRARASMASRQRPLAPADDDAA